MTDREMVIRAMECCAVGAECDHCPYSPMNKSGYEGCYKMHADALALLKAQEPRVLTLEEIPERQEMTCWLEWRDDDFYAAILYANDLKVDYMKFCTSCAFMKREYGMTVRCWTSRPTDEVRRAIPWNVQK